jgi:hypothetical protein
VVGEEKEVEAGRDAGRLFRLDRLSMSCCLSVLPPADSAFGNSKPGRSHRTTGTGVIDESADA